MRSPAVAVTTASLYLIAYYVVFYYTNDFRFTIWMFMGAPFVLGWMAYTIIRYGKFSGKELKEDEEWGYSDRDKNSLGTF